MHHVKRIVIICAGGALLIASFIYVFEYSGLFKRTAEHKEALAAYRKGEYQSTVALADDDLKKHPLSAPSYWVKGCAQMLLGDHRGAIRSFSMVLTLYPNDPDALRNRQYAFFMCGEYESAMKDTRRLLRRNSRDVNAHLNLTKYLLDNGKYISAIQACEQAISLCPNDARLWQNYGSSCYEMGYNDQALLCYDSALALSPGKRNALHGRALTLYRLGRYREATPILYELVDRGYKTCHVFWLLGDTYARLSNFEEACICYNEALDSLGYESRLWKAKADAEFNQGRDRAAFASAKMCRELAGDSLSKNEQDVALFERLAFLDRQQRR
jgi:tetratricopeptide (TPR) repeat protein